MAWGIIFGRIFLNSSYNTIMIILPIYNTIKKITFIRKQIVLHLIRLLVFYNLVTMRIKSINLLPAENWEFLLTMLQKSADKLLVKRKIDAFVKDAKFERQPRIDVFDPPAGPEHNIIGRIRPIDRKSKREKEQDGNMAFNFGTGKAVRGVVSPAALETLPETWTEESIRLTQENLKKLEAESKLKTPSSAPLDKQSEIRPPKPEEGRVAWSSFAHWTVFGYLPNLNFNETKEAISKHTKCFKATKIDDRAILFRGQKGVIGKITPKAITNKSVLAPNKNEKTSENTPSTSPKEDNTSSIPPKAEGERATDDGKKKRKRKYKKRTPKT